MAVVCSAMVVVPETTHVSFHVALVVDRFAAIYILPDAGAEFLATNVANVHPKDGGEGCSHEAAGIAVRALLTVSARRGAMHVLRGLGCGLAPTVPSRLASVQLQTRSVDGPEFQSIVSCGGSP